MYRRPRLLRTDALCLRALRVPERQSELQHERRLLLGALMHGWRLHVDEHRRVRDVHGVWRLLGPIVVRLVPGNLDLRERDVERPDDGLVRRLAVVRRLVHRDHHVQRRDVQRVHGGCELRLVSHIADRGQLRDGHRDRSRHGDLRRLGLAAERVRAARRSVRGADRLRSVRRRRERFVWMVPHDEPVSDRDLDWIDDGRVVLGQQLGVDRERVYAARSVRFADRVWRLYGRGERLVRLVPDDGNLPDGHIDRLHDGRIVRRRELGLDVVVVCAARPVRGLVDVRRLHG